MCCSTTSGTTLLLILSPTTASSTLSATELFSASQALETSTRSLSCSWAWPLRLVSTSLFKAAYLEALQQNLTALRRLSCLINSASKVPLDSHEELSHILMHLALSS